MNYVILMKNNIVLIISLVLLFSCSEPKIRKPVVHRSSISYFEESISVNKAILKQEEKYFKQIISKDTLNKYISSPYGFWYYYNNNNKSKSQRVKSGDRVVINYEIRDLNNNILINESELGSKNQKDKKDRLLKIDGENFLLGLHQGIKLMKKGDVVTFLMPSNQAFGATGFQDLIAPNQALLIKVKLKKIIK